LVTDLSVLLGCFVAFHVPGQTARVRGFGIKNQHNIQENVPEILGLFLLIQLLNPTKSRRPFLTRSALCNADELLLFTSHGRAKAKATAKEVTATKIGAQMPSDTADNAMIGNSLTRDTTLLAERLDPDPPSSILREWVL
jgi:hypothetical protein